MPTPATTFVIIPSRSDRRDGCDSAGEYAASARSLTSCELGRVSFKPLMQTVVVIGSILKATDLPTACLAYE